MEGTKCLLCRTTEELAFECKMGSEARKVENALQADLFKLSLTRLPQYFETHGHLLYKVQLDTMKAQVNPTVSPH